MFVFVFFGLVAVCGTAVVQVGSISGLAGLGGVGVGALSCAILVTNNLRDIPGDTIAGKRTLAVRIGDPATRRLYAALVGVALSVPALVGVAGWIEPDTWPAAGALGLGALVLAVAPLRAVRGGAAGRALVPVLVATGRLLLGYGGPVVGRHRDRGPHRADGRGAGRGRGRGRGRGGAGAAGSPRRPTIRRCAVA